MSNEYYCLSLLIEEVSILIILSFSIIICANFCFVTKPDLIIIVIQYKLSLASLIAIEYLLIKSFFDCA